MSASGKSRVRAAIAGAEPAKASKGAKLPDFLSGRFEMRADGLWRLANEPGKAAIWICAPFEVSAETRNAAGTDRGLWLNWIDREGGRHELALPFTLLTGDGGEARQRLAFNGLRMHPSQFARQALIEYLNGCTPRLFARCVPTIGWHYVGGTRVFVLPNRVFGSASEQVIFQPVERAVEQFGMAGTLDDWRSHVAALCPGNTRLLLAVSAAFAGPLLDLTGEDGGGINLKGASRLGKSSVLYAAASVWGGTSARGAADFICQWRATDNALESIAASHSDTLLVLDEMGQTDPRTLGESAYMLANGSGKLRARRDGLARPAVRFRVLFLSTGELGLADMAAKAGERAKAGQEVRLADVPADAGAGLGIWEQLHGIESPDAFAQTLRENCARFYGTAALAFLEHLVAELAAEGSALQMRLRAQMTEFSRLWLQSYPDATGQVRSVCRRFALIAVAGELATDAGITGWAAGLAADAARVCFEAWLAERGTLGAREEAQAVSQLRDFITTHGAGRFEDWKEPAEAAQAQATLLPSERFRTQQRAGWRRETVEADGRHVWRYYLTPAAMKEALRGLDWRDAMRVLVERGTLVSRDSGGKFSRPITPPGHVKVRLYEIAGTILSADEGTL